MERCPKCEGPLSGDLPCEACGWNPFFWGEAIARARTLYKKIVGEQTTVGYLGGPLSDPNSFSLRKMKAGEFKRVLADALYEALMRDRK